MLVHAQGKMKFLPLFVGVLISATSVIAQFDGCDFIDPATGEVIASTIHRITIDDDAEGVILELNTDNVLDVKDPNNSFFALTFSENILRVATSVNYVNVEQLLPSKIGETIIKLEIEITCTEVDTFYIDVTITDKNNQPTELSSEDISYNIPLPLPANIPLYLFSDTPGENKLTARDADLSNVEITFKIEPADIFEIIGELDARDPLGKTHVATLRAIQPLTKLEVNDFTITAADTDARDPATRIIKITVDVASSLPQPLAFQEKYYEGKYEISDAGEHSLSIGTLVITNADSNKISATLDEEGIEGFFSVMVDGESNIVLAKEQDLTQDILNEKDYLTLWVEAQYDSFDIPSTSVSVVITLPAKDQPGESAFIETLYTATYDIPSNEVNFEVPITVIDIQDLEFALEGAHSEHFLAVPNAETPTNIEITVPTPLPEDVINNNDYISIIVKAKTTEEPNHGSTVVVIDLPEKDCLVTPSVFDATLYKGLYEVSAEGLDTMITDKITVNSEVAVNVVIEPNDFPDNFNVNDDDPKNIIITLNQDLEENVLEDNDVISLVLVAKSTDSNTVYGSSVVIIELPPGKCPIVPTENAFGKSLYEGEYDDINEDISLTESITATASELLQIEFESDFREFFDVTYDVPPNVEIKVIKPIPAEQIEANKFMTLVLSARSVDTTKDYGETAVVIKMPSKSTTHNVFGQTLYEGTYSISPEGTHSVVFDEEITATTQNELEIKLDPPEFQQYFAININELPTVLIAVVGPGLPADVLKEPFLTLLLSAKSTDGITDYGQTGLVISLPEQKCVIEPSDDIFTSTVFEGEYTVSDNGEHGVTTSPISVILDDVVATIAGDYVNNFNVEVVDKVVTLSISNDLTEDVWKENRYISILLQGTSGTLTGAARILLTLPEPECDDPNPTVDITFLDAAFTVSANHQGDIGDPLIATFEPAEAYKITLSNHPNSIELSDTTYQLSVAANSQLKPETIRFTATVKGDVSGESKSAQITINVLPNIDGEAKTVYSMQVVDIDEDTIVADMLLLEDVPVGADVYEYVIHTQEPAEPIMFNIDAATKYLTSIKIDREDTIFDGMGVPQVVLTIGLEKKDPEITKINPILASHPLLKYMLKREKRNAQEYKQCLMLEKDILRIDSIMHVPVIINDLNDNLPIFSRTSIIVGYPTKDIVLDINPPYLLKAEATDADEGLNAIVKYSCTSTSVNINTDTGVVYPTEGLYNAGQEETLTITASDGVNEANPALTAKIVLLDKDHISVLGFPNIILEELDTTLSALTTAIGVELRALSAGSLPGSSAATLRADSDFHLKAIVYGIENDAVITHESLKGKLVGHPITIIEYIPTGTVDPSGGTEECDDTGLIAGISVLAVALAICIVGFIVFYFKKKKNNASLDLEQLPEHKTSFKRQNGLQNGLDTDVELKDVATRRPTQYPMEGPKIDPDNSSDSSTSSEDGEDFDEAKDRRKSVTFNEKTQHFDITAKENETESAKADDTENKEF